MIDIRLPLLQSPHLIFTLQISRPDLPRSDDLATNLLQSFLFHALSDPQEFSTLPHLVNLGALPISKPAAVQGRGIAPLRRPAHTGVPGKDCVVGLLCILFGVAGEVNQDCAAVV